MAEQTLYPDAAYPAYDDASDAETQRALGTTFVSSVDTYAVGARWRAPLNFPPAAKLSLWSLTGDLADANAGIRLAIKSLNFSGATPGGWLRLNWDTPIFIPASKPRVIQVWIQGGRYVYSWGGFPIDNGTLHGYDEIANGRWSNAVPDDNALAGQHYPGGSNYNYFVDIITDPSPPSGRSSGPDFLPFF